MKDFEIVKVADDDVPLTGYTPDEIQYELEDADGSTATFDVSGPKAGHPVLDAATQLRVHDTARRMAKRILTLEKRQQKLAEWKTGRTKKSRAKRALQKASRKRNR